MRRSIIILGLLCATCGREERDTTTTMPAAPPPMRKAVASAPEVSTVAPAPPRGSNRSTPQKCAGDGSYERALDCFQISAGFHFAMGEAKGEMTRPTPGMERVRFKTGDGATWTGEAKPAGVVWTRDGKHELSPPDVTNRVWQRTTMVLDPQKKEGKPQLAGVEAVSGEPCNHYHFTNANSGEVNDVWVSAKDGRIVKWTMGQSTLELR
ncbi:MAG TPA: hypothetical protein VLC46_12550 [Thermoanaerobaculia bacterium]|jgi:hypothetical protein|nr:hypothetical protein [Thermoanaerobaculia bacterium]